jgi:FAD/FMN-containing dehydrogenase
VLAEAERALVRPGAPAELVDVVRIAGEVGTTVGVDVSAGQAGIVVDLSRMSNLLELDETSLLVTAQAGITVEALDLLLAERGLFLPSLPSWSRARTVGALLAAPRPSEASPRVGRFVQACAGIQALLADGTEIATRVAPRKATGPDLMHALVGARGTLGIITAATLRVHRRQEARSSSAFRMPTLPAALSAARQLLVRGGRPIELLVTATGTLAIDVDGPEPLCLAESTLAEHIAREHGGEPVPHAPPPRLTTRPYERAVPLETVDRTTPFNGREGEAAQPFRAPDSASLVSDRAVSKWGDAVRFVGWHVAGACVVDSARAPAPTPPATPLLALLKQRLDPERRFVAWPGAA